MAAIKPEFDKRGVKVIGLSVDPMDRHAGWLDDIEETQGHRPNHPIIADTDFAVSKAVRQLPASISGDPTARTPADNQTVRNVFVIGPDKKVKLILVYPMTTGRNFDEVLRVIDSLQLTAKHKVATPVNWKQGEDVIIAGSVNDEPGEGDLARRLGVAEALHSHRQAAHGLRDAQREAGRRPHGPSRGLRPQAVTAAPPWERGYRPNISPRRSPTQRQSSGVTRALTSQRRRRRRGLSDLERGDCQRRARARPTAVVAPTERRLAGARGRSSQRSGHLVIVASACRRPSLRATRERPATAP